MCIFASHSLECDILIAQSLYRIGTSNEKKRAKLTCIGAAPIERRLHHSTLGAVPSLVESMGVCALSVSKSLCGLPNLVNCTNYK